MVPSATAAFSLAKKKIHIDVQKAMHLKLVLASFFFFLQVLKCSLACLLKLQLFYQSGVH